MNSYEDFSDCRLDRCPDSFMSRQEEDLRALGYHYVRLFKEIFKDLKRGLRKPLIGRRYVAPLTEHQVKFLSL